MFSISSLYDTVLIFCKVTWFINEGSELYVAIFCSISYFTICIYSILVDEITSSDETSLIESFLDIFSGLVSSKDFYELFFSLI